MGQKLPRTNWDFDCRAVSLDKRNNPAATQPGFASQLYGWEGNLQGGLRIHPGFKLIRQLGTLTPTNVDTTAGAFTGFGYAGGQLSVTVIHDPSGSETGSIVAGDLIEIVAGTSVNKGLYQVAARTGTGGEDIRLRRLISDDVFILNDASINGNRMLKRAMTSVSEFYDLRHFSIQIRGQTPVHGVVCRAKGTTAAGTRYTTWVEWYDVIAASWKSLVLEQSTTTTAYGSLDPNTKLDVVAWGRLLYVFREGWEPILVTATAGTSSITLSVNYDTGPGEAPTMIRNGDSSSLGNWNQSVFHDINKDPYDADETAGASNNFASQAIPSVLGNGSYGPGQSADGTGAWYTSPPPKYASMAEWDSAVKNVSSDGVGILKGNYTFAYQLKDSVTGRVSAISSFVGQPLLRFGTYSHAYWAMEIIYDSTKWDYCRIYRSVNSDAAGGTFINSLVFLEDEIKLADYTPQKSDGTGWTTKKDSVYNSDCSTSSPNPTTWTAADLGSPNKRAIYWGVLDDRELVFQPLYNNDAYFDNEMPTAGAAIVYDNTLICSRSRDGSTATTGIGEIRWSSLTEKSLELFPAENRFVPKVGFDNPYTYLQLGDRVIGFSANRQYMIYKASAYIAVREMHEGYGISNPRAACVVGNEIYAVTPKGMVVVDVTGQLEGVRAFDYVFNYEWASDLANVHMCFDSKTGCVFAMRPPRTGSYTDHGEMCLVWQTTSMASQLLHTRMVRCTQGVEPGSSDDASRALFVTNTGRLFRVDDARAKTVTNSMLDTGSATRTDCNLTLTTGTSYSTNVLSLHVPNTVTLTDDMVGCALAFTSGALDGNAYEILSINNSTHILTIGVPSNLTSSAPAGTTVCINPMVARVVQGPVGLQAEDGTSFGMNNMFRRRRVTAIGVHAIQTAGTSTNVNAKIRGVCYRADGTSALTRLPPTKNDGSEYTSWKDGPATNYAKVQRAGALICPGVEIYSAGLDGVVIGFRSVGSVESSEREAFSE